MTDPNHRLVTAPAPAGLGVVGLCSCGWGMQLDASAADVTADELTENMGSLHRQHRRLVKLAGEGPASVVERAPRVGYGYVRTSTLIGAVLVGIVAAIVAVGTGNLGVRCVAVAFVALSGFMAGAAWMAGERHQARFAVSPAAADEISTAP